MRSLRPFFSTHACEVEMYRSRLLNPATYPALLAVIFALCTSALVQAKEPFSAMDVFKIAYAANPVVSPNGQIIAFDRFYMDVMTDSRRSDLWLIDSDGQNLRQISKGFDAVGSAAFTPAGDAIAFVAVDGEASHIYLQQLDSGERTELGQNKLVKARIRLLVSFYIL